MTLKAKPVVKRAQRPGWESQDRRNFLLNVGFGLVVLLALVLLLVAAGLSWYNDHLAPVGSVDGESITRDELRDRFEIESWRLDEAERRIRTAVVAGYLSEADGQSQLSSLADARNNLASLAMERVIDTKLQAKLAVEEGISVTDADVDAQLLEEATSPEQRHAWVIEVAPELDPGAIEPTPAQRAAARALADKALADLEAGTPWEEVAETTSTDTSTAGQGGDLGWIRADDTQFDAALLTALFAAEANVPSEVIEGDDGTFRIGRVTEIVAETVDGAYQDKLTNDGIDLAKYRAVVRADVIHEKLEEKIVAQVTGPSLQRRVQQIYIRESDPALGEDAIKVRHILYSPNDDPSGAGSLDANDPAWDGAEQEARATYERLQEDADLFDSIARAESDEGSAQGPTGSGGKLPYFDSQSAVDEAFLEAIMNPDLEAGDLLEPIKSSFGWHVIQVMYRPTDGEQMAAIKAQAEGGADFALLARDNSEDEYAGDGGELGWVARGQLETALVDAIFAAELGSVTDVIAVEGDGLYLFKVLEEETRTPEGRQLEQLKATAFSDWYGAKKDAVEIDRGDGSSVSSDS